MSLAPPITPRLEGDAEVARREHDKAIRALQALPAMATRIINDVSLADGVETPVAHGLGRVPRIAIPSAPRGASTAGLLEEVRTGSHDRTRYVVLKASGFGATVIVDVEVK